MKLNKKIMKGKLVTFNACTNLYPHIFYYPLCEVFENDVNCSRGYKAVKVRIYWSDKEEDGYKELYMPDDWLMEITDEFVEKWSNYFPVKLYNKLQNRLQLWQR
jgi:hypothetical protein